MLRRHFGEPPHKTRRPSPPSTPLGRRGSPGRTPPQGGPLPRTAPTRATAPPRPGQRSWRALAPRLRGAPPPPGQRTGAARARRAPRQRGGGWSLLSLSVAVQHAVTTTALSGEWLLPATAPHLGLGALLRRDQSWTWRLSCAGRFPPPLGRSIASQDSPVV